MSDLKSSERFPTAIPSDEDDDWDLVTNGYFPGATLPEIVQRVKENQAVIEESLTAIAQADRHDLELLHKLGKSLGLAAVLCTQGQNGIEYLTSGIRKGETLQ